MKDLCVTKNINGSFTLATIHNGYRVWQTYYGYTLKDCKQMFREYLKATK